jgi:hypothetical protein
VPLFITFSAEVPLFINLTKFKTVSLSLWGLRRGNRRLFHTPVNPAAIILAEKLSMEAPANPQQAGASLKKLLASPD